MFDPLNPFGKIKQLVKDIHAAELALDAATRKQTLYTERNYPVPKWLAQEINDWEQMLKELKAEHATYPGSRYNEKNKHLIF